MKNLGPQHPYPWLPPPTLADDSGPEDEELSDSASTASVATFSFRVETNPHVMKIPLIPDRPIAALSEKTIKTIEAVPSVNNTQIALLLLRQINNGSLTYTLRTATPNCTEGITETFTKKILQALAKILD